MNEMGLTGWWSREAEPDKKMRRTKHFQLSHLKSCIVERFRRTQYTYFQGFKSFTFVLRFNTDGHWAAPLTRADQLNFLIVCFCVLVSLLALSCLFLSAQSASRFRCQLLSQIWDCRHKYKPPANKLKNVSTFNTTRNGFKSWLFWRFKAHFPQKEGTFTFNIVHVWLQLIKNLWLLIAVKI